jgi:hypothetical protein
VLGLTQERLAAVRRLRVVVLSRYMRDELVAWGDGDGLAAALRDAVGQRAAAPPGFGREELMRRLQILYRETARRSPS